MKHIDFVQVDEVVSCTICGHTLDKYETKEGPGAAITLDYRDINKFYSRCNECNNLIEFELNQEEELKTKKELSIASYKKTKVIY